MEVDQLIAEIARATGLRLDKADPVLAVAVINEALLDRALVKLDRQVKLQADRVTAASTQAIADAQKAAELLVTDTGEWIDRRMKAAGECAAALLLTELRQETQAAQKARRMMVRTAWFTAATCLVALSGAGGIVLAGLR